MKLSELYSLSELNNASIKGDCEIKSLSQDSRKMMDNALFFCIVGAHFDAHNAAEQAIKNGAVALVVERWLDSVSVPQILVEDTRLAMALIASAFYGHPSRKMRMVGITGTKGKTTTSYLLKSIVDAAGAGSGLIGSIGNWIKDKREPGNLTTPDPIELNEILKRMYDSGVEIVCMEVSAHAIDMNRIAGIHYSVGAFTNFSQDHLDYFETMEKYFSAKEKFMLSDVVENAVINVDDDKLAAIFSKLKCPRLSYGISRNADIFARNIDIVDKGISFDLVLSGQNVGKINMNLMGNFNVYNALAAASIALTLGIKPKYIVKGLEEIKTVPGRAELLDTHTPYSVVLDYSHAPAALENILKTFRKFVKNRLIVVFGCGGNRDRVKRSIMGKISGENADISILTSDNPRNEDPFEILKDIEEGILQSSGKYEIIENRRDAIRKALSIAGDGDIIVLAGKGDETYQEIKGVKYPFDERIVVKELLCELEGN